MDRAAQRAGDDVGFGRPQRQRPAITVIDVNYNFCGDWREPIPESIKRWHFSCGERAWDGIDAIRNILNVARRKRLPVSYTTNPRREDGFDLGVWTLKGTRSDEEVGVLGHKGNVRTTILCANLAHEMGAFGRFIIATDTSTGSGVMPLGMLYTIAHCASLIALPPEWFLCAATGSNARTYRLNSGFLAAGRGRSDLPHTRPLRLDLACKR